MLQNMMYSLGNALFFRTLLNSHLVFTLQIYMCILYIAYLHEDFFNSDGSVSSTEGTTSNGHATSQKEVKNGYIVQVFVLLLGNYLQDYCLHAGKAFGLYSLAIFKNVVI